MSKFVATLESEADSAGSPEIHVFDLFSGNMVIDDDSASAVRFGPNGDYVATIESGTHSAGSPEVHVFELSSGNMVVDDDSASAVVFGPEEGNSYLYCTTICIPNLPMPWKN